jgi:thymidylate kinase
VAAEAPAGHVPAPPWLGLRRGLLVSVEGLWGAGKTTIAAALGEHLTAAGFATEVLHYGPRRGVVGALSQWLETAPLRSRHGAGGYAQPHHASVDVLLRLCREAYDHRHTYRPALEANDIVVLDRGVYSKLAYALAVLGEQHPAADPAALLALVESCVRPWFLHPDLAFFLDVPWPLARERAILRAGGSGDPGSVERLLFLPCYAAAYRRVIAAHPDRTVRIRVGARGPAGVLAEIHSTLSAVLHAPIGSPDE